MCCSDTINRYCYYWDAWVEFDKNDKHLLAGSNSNVIEQKKGTEYDAFDPILGADLMFCDKFKKKNLVQIPVDSSRV